MKLSFSADLPITERLDEIKEVLAANQVVIVAGETGSGKSTQLPKICLELGLGDGAKGGPRLIGHTQPRRLAARAVAERIAEETETKVGDLVGYKVRFTDEVSKSTRIKLMTDGVLLAEMQRDRFLSRYACIIIDEAHERSLNIDFLLGYLRQLLPRRPDLKVIVTSATIDTERFSQHFDNAPVVEVSGRTYPVEVRYRPNYVANQDQAEGICEAVRELWRDQSGDILVFCSGERDIRDAHGALDDLKLANCEVFPLYARLSAAEQHRVFTGHKGRRIVLATNVAETSLTVPGIRTVIDPGNVRMSRYSNRTKVQRLPIEPVSQASANQRAGRCGRVAPGVCIRLYSEDDYLTRPEFTDPEIKRTNLASVILQMASLGLGNVSAFPFIEPPEQRNIRDGIALLEELDAVDPDQFGTKRWLTPMGRQLAKLPVDPRLGRMIVEAGHNNCLHEVMIIVAAMSVQDPRERPSEKRAAADEFHRRFAHPSSDFLSYVELWDYVKRERSARSQNQFRKLCRNEFINFNRVREWQDTYRQLRRVAKELKLDSNRTPAKPDDIHYSLLAGLLSHIGIRDDKTDKAAKSAKQKASGRPGSRGSKPKVEFVGARNARFLIANGSVLAKKPPVWVMAGELVETNRLWARTLTQIDPAWAERLGAHLVKRIYTEPWWDEENGAALTTERVSLFGLPIVAGRRRNLDHFDEAMARQMFIHHALVEGDWDASHDFVGQNDELIQDIAALEARSRQSDLLADQSLLYDFYDERIPQTVTSSRHFGSWWKKKRDANPSLLNLTRQLLLDGRDDGIHADSFPDRLEIGGLALSLAYEFDPTSPIDGITVDVPIAALNQLAYADFSWLVPGFLAEAVELLLRTLPKTKRKTLLPIPDTANAILDDLDPKMTLVEAIGKEVGIRYGLPVEEGDMSIDSLPRHLRPTFRVVDDEGETLAAGKNLESLQARLGQEIRDSLESTAHPLEQVGLTTWDFGDLPQEIETNSGRHTICAYPSVIDEGDSVSVRLMASVEEQTSAMWLGTRRLIRLNVPAPMRKIDRSLGRDVQLALSLNTTQTKAAWFVDVIDCAVDHVISEGGGPRFEQEGYEMLEAECRRHLPELIDSASAILGRVVLAVCAIDIELAAWEDNERMNQRTRERLAMSLLDIRAHRDRLVYPGLLVGVGYQRLSDLARYLEAIVYRLGCAPGSVAGDKDLLGQCQEVEMAYAKALVRSGPSEESEDISWMIEEMRAARFAPHLPSPSKMTSKKIRLAIQRL